MCNTDDRGFVPFLRISRSRPKAIESWSAGVSCEGFIRPDPFQGRLSVACVAS
jgi:hypothetical protein